MKNYGTIKVNGVKAIGVFKIAGHDWALYMPPCKKDKNDRAHAYERFTERKVDLTLLKGAVEQYCDELLEIAILPLSSGGVTPLSLLLWATGAIKSLH